MVLSRIFVRPPGVPQMIFQRSTKPWGSGWYGFYDMLYNIVEFPKKIVFFSKNYPDSASYHECF